MRFSKHEKNTKNYIYKKFSKHEKKKHKTIFTESFLDKEKTWKIIITQNYHLSYILVQLFSHTQRNGLTKNLTHAWSTEQNNKSNVTAHRASTQLVLVLLTHKILLTNPNPNTPSSSSVSFILSLLFTLKKKGT